MPSRNLVGTARPEQRSQTLVTELGDQLSSEARSIHPPLRLYSEGVQTTASKWEPSPERAANARGDRAM